MGRKLIMLIFILLALSGLTAAYVVGGTQAYSRYQQSHIATQRHCADQAPVHICVVSPAALFSAFYPSYFTKSPPNPLFSIEYSSTRAITLSGTMTINGFSQSQTLLLQANAGLQTSTFLPPLINQGQVLSTLTHEVQTFLHVQVNDTARHLYYISDIPLVLHSRWLMQWTKDNLPRVAAWVTPGDPAVGALVTKAAIHLKEEPLAASPGMYGYNVTTSQQVVDQVDALYDTLRRDYKMKYTNESVPYTGGSSANATEVIKLPSEVLQQGSGMCIELTLLLASAAEKIHLHTAIVIIPGHAFLGVAVTADNTVYQFWDPAYLDNNVAADSANVRANQVYQDNVKHGTIVDTIFVSDARSMGVDAML